MDGGDDCMLVEWEPSLFPDGAHPVNIQRGDRGFGINLVEQKVRTHIPTQLCVTYMYMHRDIYVYLVGVMYSIPLYTAGPNHRRSIYICTAYSAWQHSRSGD